MIIDCEINKKIEAAEKMENLFEQGVNDILRCHINHIIEKYAGRKHYPRKIKKMLKKKDGGIYETIKN